MARRKALPPEDDGRSYADMNVDGMPWYSQKAQEDKRSEKINLSPKEARSAMLGALTAALLIALVFAAIFAGFILFCDHVWFK